MDQGSLDGVLANAAFVRRLAGALARDDSEADDVAQEALLRGLPGTPGRTMDIRSWLAGVTRNVFRMRRRTEARRSRRERAAARPERIPSPEEQAERLDLLDRLASALSDLEEPYRSTVVLRYYDHRSPAEIARLTSTPLDTVKTRLRRGLARLRISLVRGDRRGPAGLRSVLLLLAGRRPAIAAPTAAAGFAPGHLTGAILMITKSKVALVALALLALGATLGLLPSGPTAAPDGPGSRGLPVPTDGPPEVVAAPGTAPENGTPAVAVRGREGEGVEAGAGVVEGRAVDREGHPVAGVRILVYPGADPRSPAGFARFGPGRAEAVTDGDGRFRVGGLDGDRFRLVVVSPEFARFEADVAPGADPIRISLSPGFAIAGRVTDAETGRGMAGLPVVAMSIDDPRSGPRSVFCEEDGGFRLEGLGGGPWKLLVGPEVQDGQHAWEDYRIRTMTPVEAGTTNLRVELFRGLPIEGEVLDSEGVPVPAGVRVLLTGLTPDGRMDHAFRRYTATREGGRFRIGGLPEGRYHLSFRPETGADPSLGATLTAVDAPDVTAGATGLVVRMSRGRTIGGRVENDAGEAVGPPTVLYVYPRGGEPGDPGTVMAIVSPEGAFRTAPLSGEITWDIYATGAPGHGSAVRKGIFAGEADVVIVLPRTRRISGRVLDSERRPVGAGVPVLARAAGPGREVEHATGFAVTTADGRFVVEGLGDHEYSLWAGAGDTGFQVGGPVHSIRTGAEDVELRVEEGVEFSARLLDAQGVPVRTRLIQAYRPDAGTLLAHRAATEDEQGRFTLRGLTPGPVRILALIGDRNLLVGELTAPARDVEIRLPPR